MTPLRCTLCHRPLHAHAVTITLGDRRVALCRDAVSCRRVALERQVACGLCGKRRER